ncbi:UvrD-helicase domain-containing protein [Paenibacillus sp. BR1-192]|uniref:HelD family protein n=1 Tax=Paenibacillus sp. BR1-192 TaxID=3032287 RepID=UPI00240D35C9|nr:UvrD-helicase domain-containing protein [Paenibacillus sp. BR1-192]WFB57052.1 AAA family ATPase [Paenibacillus sp. BR1-192]
MLNPNENAEREYLALVLKELQRASEELEGKVSDSYKDIIEAKKYLWVNMAQLDAAERAANRVDISLSIDTGEKQAARLQRMRKLLASPYFGRVDFRTNEPKEEEGAYYIGTHSFTNPESQEHLIYDWRSPVASLFYDYNAGPASYEAPMGRLQGEITVKRQYKIKDGHMEYMIESSMNINDDVLQKELSSNSDEKMKNIVATIQQEQNAIIRNETAHELIIQGAAGSGKTSVALHRVAFLLYRHKETLTSSNVLIISPHKVFSDYISSVLPELGEEKIMEVTMEELAAKELRGLCQFQTFSEQVDEIVHAHDEQAIERIRYKAGLDFVHELDAYLEYGDQQFFQPTDIQMKGVLIPASEVMDKYLGTMSLPVRQRLEKTASVLSGQARTEDGERLTSAEANKVKAAIRKMFTYQNALSLYKAFFSYRNIPDLFIMKGRRTIEYADVFPLIYLKMHLEGSASYDMVKHLLVDEMQDYTPIQYAVISKWFACKKTILGDSNQSVNVYTSTSLPDIQRVFPQADTIELVKSYRSTLEIMKLAKRIHPRSTMIPVERHGEEPLLIRCHDAAQELAFIQELTRNFPHSGMQTMGIICKTSSQARQVYESVRGLTDNVSLLDFSSDRFQEGITITSAHMAKGLEFDQVIVPFAGAANYRTEMDRSLLYIACTRAMHKLLLTYSGEPAVWLAGSA